jgi:hypothetical protein
MPEFPEALERSIEIRARPETVFRYFTIRRASRAGGERGPRSTDASEARSES